jgi:hypothetical protein
MAYGYYPGIYAYGDPYCMPMGAGMAGACAAGTCSGGVAAGGCGGAGGCGTGGGCVSFPLCLPFQYGLKLTFRSQAEAWEADAVGQEAAVGEEVVEEEVVAVDAEVVVVRMRNYAYDMTKEWDGKGGERHDTNVSLLAFSRWFLSRSRLFLNEMRPRINSESISRKCSVQCPGIDFIPVQMASTKTNFHFTLGSMSLKL